MMARAWVSAFAIVLTSAPFSGAFACDPDRLKEHFSSLKEEEAKRKSFSLHQYCGVLRHNPGDFETVKKLKDFFEEEYETDTAAKATMNECTVEQVIKAAC